MFCLVIVADFFALIKLALIILTDNIILMFSLLMLVITVCSTSMQIMQIICFSVFFEDEWWHHTKTVVKISHDSADRGLTPLVIRLPRNPGGLSWYCGCVTYTTMFGVTRLLTLVGLFFVRKYWNIFALLSFLNTSSTGSWKSSMLKPRNHFSFIVNMMVIDDLTRQEARASVSIVLT